MARRQASALASAATTEWKCECGSIETKARVYVDGSTDILCSGCGKVIEHVPYKPNSIRETVVGSKTHAAKLPDDVTQLLKESVETIKHINHQNEFTRSFVERAQEVIESQENPLTKET